MNINIQTIPHSKQRYPTVGDWWFDSGGDLQIRVSDMNNPNYEFLIARHELDEAMLCAHRGISEHVVTAFDVGYEDNRKEGDTSEPGDSKYAPYRKEHFTATSFERLMAIELNVDWEVYAEAVQNL